MRIGVHFSDFFNVSPEVLDAYGAFNISLISDMPLFIDPFLLFSSDKPQYQQLHKQILRYLSFLKRKAESGISVVLVKSLYSFPEVKQNWLGYSEFGNQGHGLGRNFALNMHSVMPRIFKDLGNEKITVTSHLEKMGLFNENVGRDNISDFTTNLILDHLLTYTQEFAKKYLKPEYCARFNVKNACFDYQMERWMPCKYYLPKYGKDYVLLTPKDLLTRDETWINSHDMLDHFEDISESLDNDILRSSVNDYFHRQIPVFEMSDKEKYRYIKLAKWKTIKEYPELIEYYIDRKEKDKDNAVSIANEKVVSVQDTLVTWVHDFIQDKLSKTAFYNYLPNSSYREALARIGYFKKCIEDNDVYKIFYHSGKPVREEIIQLAFKLVWHSTEFDVNREVNNGRGPADYKISKGAKDKAIIEFKLARNKNLRKNLENQLEIYKNANDTEYGIVVIFYYKAEEKDKTEAILRELNLDNRENVILVDCSLKQSASKVG